MSLTPPTRHRPLALTLALLFAAPLAASLAAPPVHAQEASPGRHSYAIPAGTLEDVLTRFTAAANIPLSFDPALVGGLGSPGLNGSYSKAEGLRQILQGSGLVAEPQGNGSYTLRQRPAPASAAESQKTLSAVIVSGARTKDEIGHDNVYNKNVTNLYQDREQLQRLQVTNPGDVFKGMSGVYSMDSRNSSSITPNVRGLSGEGRVPLTVDGTEQSTNVWLQVYGAGNRNYVDPAMFRSIEVEKGPSLSRGVKTGVGGSVNVRTIEASDIIPEGKNFGLELKLESSGNTAKPQVDANSYFGKDYRDIPGAVLGAANNVNIPQPVPRTKSGKHVFNFGDHSEMITFAARNDVADLLLSHSRRSKGNYFAGKQGAGKYTHNDAYAKDTAAFFPNLTKLWYPGNEIFSTSSNSETTLLKNNWYLPNGHKLGWSFMRSDLEFAETGSAQSIGSLGFAEALDIDGQIVAEFPRSELRLDTWKLSHEWKPDDSRWIDLQSNLWMTKTKGTRHQTGSGAYYIKDSEALKQYGGTLANWKRCNPEGGGFPDLVNPLPNGDPALNCLPFSGQPYRMGEPQPGVPDHDGRIYAGSAQWTSHDRVGFDLNNLMRLSDTLRLTMGGSFQHEKLNERVARMELSGGGLGPDGSMFHYATENFGPRSGKRDEYSGMFNFEWQATPWLTLTAGARYNRYSSYDEGLAERRRQRIDSARAWRVKTGVELEYGTLMTDEQLAKLKQLSAASKAARDAVVSPDIDPSAWKIWDVWVPHCGTSGCYIPFNLPTEDPTYKAAYQALADYAATFNVTPYDNIGQASATLGYLGSGFTFQDNKTGGTYWNQSVVVPLVDGKLDASQSPLASNPIDPSQTASQTNQATGVAGEYALYAKGNGSNQGTALYREISADRAWAMPDKQSGEAWSPMLSATARLTRHGTVFLRYAQTTRFPSIFEIASTSTNLGGTVGELSLSGASKPERSTNWEIGYAHDLTQFFPSLRMADARLSYFDTTIEDFVERDSTLNIIQFDEKKTSGIEFQSRFDSGRYFGSLGATYRLTQKLCDEDYAYGMDPYYNRMPKCMTGGFPDTLTATSLQPKYSINAELGTRLLNGRLELGWRSVYHAKAENDDLDKVLRRADAKEYWIQSSMSQLYWHSVVLHDLYARMNLSKDLVLNVGVTNLTDRYYMDPMSKIPVPGPGRTVTAGLVLRF